MLFFELGARTGHASGLGAQTGHGMSGSSTLRFEPLAPVLEPDMVLEPDTPCPVRAPSSGARTGHAEFPPTGHAAYVR